MCKSDTHPHHNQAVRTWDAASHPGRVRFASVAFDVGRPVPKWTAALENEADGRQDRGTNEAPSPLACPDPLT